MHAFVVMPDHVHMLFTPLIDETGNDYTLKKIMNGIKGASSHRVNKLVGRRGTLWEPESFDRILRSSGDFEYRMIYIIENPIAAGLAKEPDEYPWFLA
jgi:REP element-mobilizing transposase RayT